MTLASVVSAIAVVFLHVNNCFWQFSTGRYWFTANIIESVFYFAVPIFFMISGAMLIDFNKRYGLKKYFNKRITKTVIPYIVWSFIGLAFQIYVIQTIALNDVSLTAQEKYDLLFGSIRPYFGKVGFSPINGVVTGTVHSFKPKKAYYFSLVLSLISSKDFINYTVSVSKGTKMPSVKWDDFVDYEIFIPEDLDYIRKFDNLVFPFIKKIDYNIHEIQKLKKLRDTLLPKLMSGEIDVSKVNCDLKLIIKKIILKFINLFIGGFKYENKNNIKNSKSNETFFKPRTIFKINK